VQQAVVAADAAFAVIAGMAIVITVLGLNLLGDGLRDLFDPRTSADR